LLRDLARVPQDFRVFHAECDRFLHFGVGLRVVPAGGERPGVGIESEGIVPALEPAHAIGWLAREAGRSVPSGSTVLVTLSGRGDKDAAQVAERLGELE